jgi:uncharacterized phage protein (TIGR01671 family)
MKDIKCKVWAIHENRFVNYYSLTNDFVHVAEGDQYYLCNNLNASEEHKKFLTEKEIEIRDEFVLLLFTGLKDKNGKEICKGDIIDCVGVQESTKSSRMVVGWSDKYASFCLDRKGWAFSHYFGEAVDPEKCEIIGNIYENPDLNPMN